MILVKSCWVKPNTIVRKLSLSTTVTSLTQILPKTHTPLVLWPLQQPFNGIPLSWCRGWGVGGGLKYLRFQTAKGWCCWGRESAAGSCCRLATHGKTPWCPALWVEPGSVQVTVVGAAELGARGRWCPILMCWEVVFVKTGPLMTPPAPVNLEAICSLSTENIQAWSSPASAECLFTHST